MKLPRFSPVALLLLLAAPSSAQQLTSPGQSSYSRLRLGQVTRFSNEFNPAFGVVLDAYGDYLDWDTPGMEDGADLVLRILEVNAAAQVDPDAWAFIVISSEELEDIAVEEGAVVYTGLDSYSDVKIGRFFIDFGKLMQFHLEELRTLERPLVLRRFLGEELAGTGIQYNRWSPLGDKTVGRFSVGVFADLLSGGHGHGEEEEVVDEALASVPERKDLDELSITARVTAMRDIGDNGQLQVGASLRHVPEFTFASGDLAVSGNSNTVWAADITFEHVDDTGNEMYLVGGEYVQFTGDLEGELEGDSIAVLDGSRSGYYVFGEYGWSGRNSAGIQYSAVESIEDASLEDSEFDLYFSRHLTELRRIRFGLTFGDSDEIGESVRAYVQFTNFFGTHSHGVQW